jgi:hypothetical protein
MIGRGLRRRQPAQALAILRATLFARDLSNKALRR